jgi:phosphate transport system substrate-binding protein
MMTRRQLLQSLGAAVGVGVAATIAGVVAYPYFSAKPAKDLMISGSKAVSRFVSLLIAPFIEKYPTAKAAIEGGSSFAGLVALANGGIDVAMMSRDINFEEFNLEMHSHLIGIEGIAIVVHPELNIKNISFENLALVLEGHIANWSELGGPNKKITVYNRAEGSSTRAFVEDVILRGASFDRNFKMCASAAEVVNGIEADQGGIGYVTIRNLIPKLKPLDINGVAISEKAILLKLYPLTRDMFLVNKNSASAVAKDFIQYSLSSPAQDIFVKNGLTQVSG